MAQNLYDSFEFSSIRFQQHENIQRVGVLKPEICTAAFIRFDITQCREVTEKNVNALITQLLIQIPLRRN